MTIRLVLPLAALSLFVRSACTTGGELADSTESPPPTATATPSPTTSTS